MGIADEIAGALRTHPVVRDIGVALPEGHLPATPPSFQNLYVSADDFQRLSADLPALVAPYDPLAAQWDRLAEHARFMLVLPGPVKVDLNFGDVPRRPAPPWRIGPDTLAAMDAHFWDWALWLAVKLFNGKPDRAFGELLKMSCHLLEPLGIPDVPTDLAQAADRFVRARTFLENRYGHRVPRRLEAAVLPQVRASHNDRFRPSGLRS